jgi:hypothetical protein
VNKLHPDVIDDLVVLCETGEASAATRALVEEQLALDPGLAQRVAASRAGTDLPATEPPPPSAEKKALDQTKRLLRTRSQALAVALVFTALPLSIVVRHGEITFLLVRDAPHVAAVWWLTAAVMWGVYFWIRRRMRPGGF